MKAVCVDPALIGEAWPHFSHLIQGAFEYEADQTFAEVEELVLSGEYLLWLAADDNKVFAAAVTRLWKSTNRKFCSVIAVGGTRLHEWKDCGMAAIEKYAADEGCDVVRLAGRRGWKRIFKTYAEPWVLLEKEIVKNA